MNLVSLLGSFNMVGTGFISSSSHNPSETFQLVASITWSSAIHRKAGDFQLIFLRGTTMESHCQAHHDGPWTPPRHQPAGPIFVGLADFVLLRFLGGLVCWMDVFNQKSASLFSRYVEVGSSHTYETRRIGPSSVEMKPTNHVLHH